MDDLILLHSIVEAVIKLILIYLNLSVIGTNHWSSVVCHWEVIQFIPIVELTTHLRLVSIRLLLANGNFIQSII